jgi:hypothetical protein
VPGCSAGIFQSSYLCITGAEVPGHYISKKIREPSMSGFFHVPARRHARLTRILACAGLLFTCTTHATITEGDDPFELFDSARNFTVTSKVTWIPVDNVQATCEREARIRGYAAFDYELKACSFYENDICVVFTEKKLNMHTLGHEVRHCFQANWHE